MQEMMRILLIRRIHTKRVQLKDVSNHKICRVVEHRLHDFPTPKHTMYIIYLQLPSVDNSNQDSFSKIELR